MTQRKRMNDWELLLKFLVAHVLFTFITAGFALHIAAPNKPTVAFFLLITHYSLVSSTATQQFAAVHAGTRVVAQAAVRSQDPQSDNKTKLFKFWNYSSIYDLKKYVENLFFSCVTSNFLTERNCYWNKLTYDLFRNNLVSLLEKPSLFC